MKKFLTSLRLWLAGSFLLLSLTAVGLAAYAAFSSTQSEAVGWNAFAMGASAAGLLAVVVYGMARRLLLPIADLASGVKRVTQGELGQPVPVRAADELGQLAVAFNAMQAELRESHLQLEDYARALERRMTERAAELREVNTALSRRALQLEISSWVGRQATASLELDELLTQVVNLIQSLFGFYFVGIWLVADKQDRLILRAAAGRPVYGLPAQDLSLALDAPAIITGVCNKGVYRLVNDVSQVSDYVPLEAWPETRSKLALPLLMGEKAIGVLDLCSDTPATFEPDDTMMMQTLADQIAVAIHNTQLYKAEQTRRQFAEALERAGRELASNLDLREVPGRILEQLAAVAPYEHGAVMLQYDDRLQIIAQHGFPQDKPEPEAWLQIRTGDVFHQVLTSGRPVVVDDVARDPGCQAMDWAPTDRSWLGVPLISRDRVIGMMSLTRGEANAFDHNDTTLVATFAGQAAIALENASLYDEIGHFNEQLEQMVFQRTEELKQAYQTLEKTDQTKTDFINVAAHELRTPLTLIKAYTQLLEPMLAQNQDAQPLLQGILNGQTRLHEVVNSLLDMSRITSEALDVHLDPTRLPDVLRHVHNEFKPALKERRLTLTVDDLSSLPTIEADVDLLSKVFHHLIGNAIKYTPDGGSITVSGKLLSAVEAEPFVEIVVSDTGIGIDPAYHEMIFEKFFQTGRIELHSSGRIKFKGGGPGLGLAIAKGIVLAHGGRIWVESAGYDEERCPGSQFHVCLPVKPRAG